MDYIKSVLKSLWSFLGDQLPIIGKAIAGIWFFFGGIHVYIYAVMVLVFIDVITGVIAARKKGEAITSRKLRKGLLEKLLLYMLLLLTVFVLDLVLKSVFNHTSFYFVFILTFLISTYEVVSVFENISVLKPQIPFLNALIRIFKKMGDKAVTKMEERVDDIVDEVTDVKNKLADKEVKKDGEQKSE